MEGAYVSLSLGRASSRINTQLSAAIYDKALRITDQGGVVSKKKGDDGAPVDDRDASTKGKDKEPAGKKDDKKEKSKEDSDSDSDASVGKIVNLMSIDTRRVWEQASGMPHIYVRVASFATPVLSSHILPQFRLLLCNSSLHAFIYTSKF